MYNFSLYKQLLRTYTALRTLYGFCTLSSLCVRIRILRFKRLVPTNTSFSYLQRIGDLFNIAMMFFDSFDVAMTVVLDVHRFVQRSDDRHVCMTAVIGRLEDPSEGCDLQGSFL